MIHCPMAVPYLYKNVRGQFALKILLSFRQDGVILRSMYESPFNSCNRTICRTFNKDTGADIREFASSRTVPLIVFWAIASLFIKEKCYFPSNRTMHRLLHVSGSCCVYRCGWNYSGSN